MTTSARAGHPGRTGPENVAGWLAPTSGTRAGGRSPPPPVEWLAQTCIWHEYAATGSISAGRSWSRAVPYRVRSFGALAAVSHPVRVPTSEEAQNGLMNIVLDDLSG